MLEELAVTDLGVIASTSLLLGPGMTVLTGETGAGKTMIVEAIDLLVGGRADGAMVRPGAPEAVVEGRFVGDGEEIVLRRVIPREGRSRAYVNGRLATVAELSEVGRALVDLHGQHAHQSLLSTRVQRAALDRFGQVDLGPLTRARARLARIEEQLAALGGDERARAREIDLLQFQVDEIDKAEIAGPTEDEELEREEDMLAGALEHRQAAAEALRALTGDGGADDGLACAIGALGGRAPLEAIAQRLRGIAAELADVSSELRAALETIEDDPVRLEEVRARRKLLHDLRRKYGDTLAEVLRFRHEAARRLEELASRDETAARLEAEREAARAEVVRAEQAVGQARRRAAPALASAVRANLAELALEKARLEVHVGDDPGDEVAFLLGANPGAPLLPLSKVASGGELSRAMLALRLVLTEAPDTLVFDEVDAGIGGEAAIAVGRALAGIAERHQVLVVTHLPQVAVFAQRQYLVGKQVRRGQTFTTAEPVDGEARVAELARMLSGNPRSEPAREHARALLQEARAATGTLA
ncbi:MAG: DNA repair protein RecN [Acidimicrobiales bacterium]